MQIISALNQLNSMATPLPLHNFDLAYTGGH